MFEHYLYDQQFLGGVPKILSVGRASFSIYLVHIGMIKSLFPESIYTETGMVKFSVITIVGVILIQSIVVRINKHLFNRDHKTMEI